MWYQVIRSQKHQVGLNDFLLAICIPTWNRMDALKTQLNRIAHSLGSAVEVVVVDNGSDDSTWHYLCNEVEENRLALICFRNRFNIGVSANTVRALEASSAQWTWIIGDSHQLNFVDMGGKLLSELPDSRSDLIMLLDNGEISVAWHGPSFLDVDSFMQPANDYLGILFYQSSRVVVRTVAAQRLVINAYKYGMADLHGFAHTYAPLLADSGLTIISAGLFRHDTSAGGNKRWDLVEGHIGAWKSSLLLFGSHRSLAAKRERRLRSKWLLDAIISALKSSTNIHVSVYLFALKHMQPRCRWQLLRIASSEFLRKGLEGKQLKPFRESGY